MLKVKDVGKIGVIKDYSDHELPPNAWTDASNIRFLDGLIHQAYGYGEVYEASNIPQHILPCTISGASYWVYLTASNAYAVTNTGGSTVTTDLTHATPLTGVSNEWTSTLLGGIPIVNAGNTSNVPAYWDLNVANNFVDLPNWPASTYCKSLRSFKNYLIALGVTKSGTTYNYMVKWSHPADPGSLPSSWDETDATKDAGELDLSEGNDIIVDGLQLRDSFIIYKENSIWRMDHIGGPFIFKVSKILGNSGAMNRNCIIEIDGFHVVLTGFDVIVHDGQTSKSILDKQARRDLFSNIDADAADKCFIFKNPFFNEVYICYPSLGSSVPDKACVWNYVDKTISYRDIPNIHHARHGIVDNSLIDTWETDGDTWDSDITLWNSPSYVPNTARAIMCPNESKLYMLDASATNNGTNVSSYVERKGMSFDSPESIKLIRGIRPRIKGSQGTIIVSVGYQDDINDDPTYTDMTYTIGETLKCDCLVSGRYIAIKFTTGTATQYRIDSYDIDVVPGGFY